MGEDAARIEFDELPERETDALPEHCHYKDEGCELADSCLNCPFEECIYDKPGGKQRWLKKERTAEMVRLYTEEGKGVKELAGIFGVSKRTVQRGLKKVLNGNNRR
jgi:hypothetical protein